MHQILKKYDLKGEIVDEHPEGMALWSTQPEGWHEALQEWDTERSWTAVRRAPS
jgi:hypothetical protein